MPYPVRVTWHDTGYVLSLPPLGHHENAPLTGVRLNGVLCRWAGLWLQPCMLKPKRIIAHMGLTWEDVVDT